MKQLDNFKTYFHIDFNDFASKLYFHLEEIIKQDLYTQLRMDLTISISDNMYKII